MSLWSLICTVMTSYGFHNSQNYELMYVFCFDGDLGYLDVFFSDVILRYGKEKLYLPCSVFIELYREHIDASHHGWQNCHQLKLVCPHGRRIDRIFFMFLWGRGRGRGRGRRITRNAQRWVQEEGDSVGAVDVFEQLELAPHLVQLEKEIPVFQGRVWLKWNRSRNLKNLQIFWLLFSPSEF